MDPATQRALIQAGASVIGTGLSAGAQGSINQRTMLWNERMYGIQRQHALEDWNRQNAYNSPAQQMQRFKEAGLNPHLIYGQMSNSPAVRSTDAGSWNPQAPEYNLGAAASNALSQFNDFNVKQAQTDNIKALTETAKQEAILKAVQALNATQDLEGKKFDLALKNVLRNNVIEASNLGVQGLQANIDKTRTDTESVKQDIITKELMREPNFQIAVNNALKILQEKKLITSQIENNRLQADLQQIDINLRRLGLNPNDPTWARMLAQALKDMFTPTPEGKDSKTKTFLDWLFR